MSTQGRPDRRVAVYADANGIISNLNVSGAAISGTMEVDKIDEKTTGAGVTLQDAVGYGNGVELGTADAFGRWEVNISGSNTADPATGSDGAILHVGQATADGFPANIKCEGATFWSSGTDGSTMSSTNWGLARIKADRFALSNRSVAAGGQNDNYFRVDKDSLNWRDADVLSAAGNTVDVNKDRVELGAHLFSGVHEASGSHFAIRKNIVSEASATGVTIAAASILNGVLKRSGQGAGQTDTLDSGTNIEAALAFSNVENMVFEFVYINNDADNITLNIGAGCTDYRATTTVTAGQAARVMFVRTAANTFDVL